LFRWTAHGLRITKAAEAAEIVKAAEAAGTTKAEEVVGAASYAAPVFARLKATRRSNRSKSASW
jgi:hypothetical protein